MSETRWTCLDCGAEYYFEDPAPNKHGGPTRRGLDRRYAHLSYCWKGKSKCPANGRKLSSTRVTLAGEGAPVAEQPDNSEAEALVKEWKANKRRARKRKESAT